MLKVLRTMPIEVKLFAGLLLMVCIGAGVCIIGIPILILLTMWPKLWFFIAGIGVLAYIGHRNRR